MQDSGACGSETLGPGQVFSSADARHLLRNKHVVVIGDSIQRGVYKDLVLFLQSNRMLVNDNTELKERAEETFMGDSLVYRTAKTKGHDFTEFREFQDKDGDHLVQYYFVTRCYDQIVESITNSFKTEPPDIVIMNSCVWDISRYGETSEEMYMEKMCMLLSRMRAVLPPTSMFIWTTTLPVASDLTPRGFLTEELIEQGLPEGLRVSILEFNYKVAQLVSQFGFDVIDMHYYMRSQQNLREKDGVHWNEAAHRHMTELILMFIHDSWKVPLPKSVTDKLKDGPGVASLSKLHGSYNEMPAFVSTTLKTLDQLADKLTAPKN